MRLKSLSNNSLKDAILWAKVDLLVCQFDDGKYASKDVQKEHYKKLHAVYVKYWDEAYRRNLVERSSFELDNEKLKQRIKELDK